MPVWALHALERAALLRIVQAGGTTQRTDPARDQIGKLLEAGYLTPYGDGTLITTPAALRAITAEIDRRAAAARTAGGQPVLDPPDDVGVRGAGP